MFKFYLLGNNLGEEKDMKEFSQWDNTEVKKLFDCIENTRINNKSLLEGFKEYAKKSKRKANSVRNYYYLEVENLRRNKDRANFLNIDLSKHEIQQSDKFSEEETEELITEILRLKCLGYSIRKACLKVANNSAGEMLRYQNKFRSVMKNNKELYNKCLLNLKKKGLTKKTDKEIKKENVIYMKKPEEKKLTEGDINSLFLGLVKLVKKTAIESLEKDFISEVEFANKTLRENLIKTSFLEKILAEKEDEIIKEKKKSKKISDENFILKTQLASLINKKNLGHSKNKSLGSYLREIKGKGIEIKTKMND